MKSKITVIFAMLLLFALTGCNNTPTNEDKTQPFSFSESNHSSAESEAPVANESNEVETTPETVQSTEPETKEQTTERNTVSSEQPQTVSDTGQAAHADMPSEVDKTENPTPNPKPGNPEQVESQMPEPEVTRPAVTEQIPETEPAFDIDYWISFAKGYAKSVGLELDSEAVYCWDNPLGAGAHSKYLERDITDCLNRYAKDEEITAVWIWAESTGDNTFNLYIGYA